MRFIYALHLIHEGMGLIIGYLSRVSLHFFHPITLAYVTSRVLRPPWDHEIRCYLWQPLLRLAFGIWLIYRCCHVSSSGRCFFDAWRWFGDGCGWLLHFVDDIWCYPDFHSTVHQLSYWGIFPFIWLRWAPSGALSLSLVIFTDQRSLVGYVEIISVLVEHRWAHSVSICGVFLR